MKRILIFLLSALCLFSCSKEDLIPPTTTSTEELFDHGEWEEGYEFVFWWSVDNTDAKYYYSDFGYPAMERMSFTIDCYHRAHLLGWFYKSPKDVAMMYVIFDIPQSAVDFYNIHPVMQLDSVNCTACFQSPNNGYTEHEFTAYFYCSNNPEHEEVILTNDSIDFFFHMVRSNFDESDI